MAVPVEGPSPGGCAADVSPEGRGKKRLGPQPRPRRIAGIALGWNGEQVAAPDVDALQLGAVIAARILEEHDDTAVGRPGRALGVEARIEHALAGTVRI